MNYELVSAADYENLPIDPQACFAALDDICQRNMNCMINENSSNDFDTAVRMQYMATMAGYARECAIAEVEQAYLDRKTIALTKFGFDYKGPSNPHWYGFSDFARLFSDAPSSASAADVVADLGLVSTQNPDGARAGD